MCKQCEICCYQKRFVISALDLVPVAKWIHGTVLMVWKTQKQRLCCSVNTFDDNLMITGSLVVITEPARLTKVVLESGSKFNTNKQKVGIGFNRSVTSIHASWPVLSIPWFVEKLQLLSTPTIACLLHWGTIYYGGVGGLLVKWYLKLLHWCCLGSWELSPCPLVCEPSLMEDRD